MGNGDPIKVLGRWTHSKAAEEHINVIFNYPDDKQWSLAIPIKCRRAGIELDGDEEIASFLSAVYDEVAPSNWDKWRETADKFWAGSRSDVTKPIFDKMTSDFGWYTYQELPTTSNPARRVQDLKDAGFTVGTRKRGGGRDLEFMIVPRAIGHASGYEYWSGKLRARIVKALRNYDAFEGKIGNPKHLLPDHKFPEARWNRDTRRDSLEHLTESEILRDFQLITNQRNQQKREVCRRCVETGERGYPFGIKFFYEGGTQWSSEIPATGKAAEAGCFGCGWYDLEKWRVALHQKITLPET